MINHIPYFSGDTFGDTFENTSIHKARFIILWKSDVSRSNGIAVCVKGVRINLGFLLSPTAPGLPFLSVLEEDSVIPQRLSLIGPDSSVGRATD